jgi:hypothetical protein
VAKKETPPEHESSKQHEEFRQKKMDTIMAMVSIFTRTQVLKNNPSIKGRIFLMKERLQVQFPKW